MNLGSREILGTFFLCLNVYEKIYHITFLAIARKVISMGGVEGGQKILSGKKRKSERGWFCEMITNGEGIELRRLGFTVSSKESTLETNQLLFPSGQTLYASKKISH